MTESNSEGGCCADVSVAVGHVGQLSKLRRGQSRSCRMVAALLFEMIRCVSIASFSPRISSARRAYAAPLAPVIATMTRRRDTQSAKPMSTRAKKRDPGCGGGESVCGSRGVGAWCRAGRRGGCCSPVSPLWVRWSGGLAGYVLGDRGDDARASSGRPVREPTTGRPARAECSRPPSPAGGSCGGPTTDQRPSVASACRASWWPPPVDAGRQHLGTSASSAAPRRSKLMNWAPDNSALSGPLGASMPRRLNMPPKASPGVVRDIRLDHRQERLRDVAGTAQEVQPAAGVVAVHQNRRARPRNRVNSESGGCRPYPILSGAAQKPDQADVLGS